MVLPRTSSGSLTELSQSLSSSLHTATLTQNSMEVSLEKQGCVNESYIYIGIIIYVSILYMSCILNTKYMLSCISSLLYQDCVEWKRTIKRNYIMCTPIYTPYFYPHYVVFQKKNAQTTAPWPACSSAATYLEEQWSVREDPRLRT